MSERHDSYVCRQIVAVQNSTRIRLVLIDSFVSRCLQFLILSNTALPIVVILGFDLFSPARAILSHESTAPAARGNMVICKGFILLIETSSFTSYTRSHLDNAITVFEMEFIAENTVLRVPGQRKGLLRRTPISFLRTGANVEQLSRICK